MNQANELSMLRRKMEQTGFCFVPAVHVRSLLANMPMEPVASAPLSDWEQFSASWNGMPLDQYMADGGRYRRRRYAVFSAGQDQSEIKLEAHQPHYQSLDYNPLNGGIAREFEQIQPEILQSDTLQRILNFGLQLFDGLIPNAAWHIECHQFRIEASVTEQGKPTPEGVHRDGVDFVLVVMVNRVNIFSGTTTMHDLERRTLDSFTLTDPLDCAIVNDRRCMHGVTPIEPIDLGQPAYRDVLVVTYRIN